MEWRQILRLSKSWESIRLQQTTRVASVIRTLPCTIKMGTSSMNHSSHSGFNLGPALASTSQPEPTILPFLSRWRQFSQIKFSTRCMLRKSLARRSNILRILSSSHNWWPPCGLTNICTSAVKGLTMTSAITPNGVTMSSNTSMLLIKACQLCDQSTRRSTPLALTSCSKIEWVNKFTKNATVRIYLQFTSSFSSNTIQN